MVNEDREEEASLDVEDGLPEGDGLWNSTGYLNEVRCLEWWLVAVVCRSMQAPNSCARLW
jgi:hypothetical protein